MEGRNNQKQFHHGGKNSHYVNVFLGLVFPQSQSQHFSCLIFRSIFLVASKRLPSSPLRSVRRRVSTHSQQRANGFQRSRLDLVFSAYLPMLSSLKRDRLDLSASASISLQGQRIIRAIMSMSISPHLKCQGRYLFRTPYRS